MNIIEIKKELYKQKPNATFTHLKNGVAHYETFVKIKDDELEKNVIVHFEVPTSDMGDVEFGSIMDAKLLNRWIVNS